MTYVVFFAGLKASLVHVLELLLHRIFRVIPIAVYYGPDQSYAGVLKML